MIKGIIYLIQPAELVNTNTFSSLRNVYAVRLNLIFLYNLIGNK
jgi:hypothetical protein